VLCDPPGLCSFRINLLIFRLFTLSSLVYFSSLPAATRPHTAFFLPQGLLRIVLVLALLGHTAAWAQLLPPAGSAAIAGTVTDAQGGPVVGATVRLQDTDLVTMSDERGGYQLRNLAPGSYTVLVSSLGFAPLHKTVRTEAGKTTRQHLGLISADKVLDEAVVVGKSATRQVNETAYNVTSVDLRPLKNTSLDLAQTLDRVAGVRMRQTAGVGSATNLTINGFGGRQVKVFLDGVPMEGFGSSFQLNNLPVNLAERVDVYRGVVPVEFGGDALGGAVNIVTSQRSRTYVDASYSFGSFNTHKTSLNARHTFANGVQAQLNFFQNYSDNNYWVHVPVLDLQTSVFSADEKRVRRFHDTYHNETVIAKIGVVGKPYADRLLVGLVAGKNHADVQTGSIMRYVFGAKFTESRTLMPTIEYRKADLLVPRLNASLNGSFNFGYSRNVDTVSRTYNWYGQSVPKARGIRAGEALYQLQRYYDHNGAGSLVLDYRPGDKHFLTLSNVLSTVNRTVQDEAEVNAATAAANQVPRVVYKHVLGGSYQYRYSEHWNSSLLLKRYSQFTNSVVDTDPGNVTRNEEVAGTLAATGYGLTTTYLYAGWQVKGSYERALRLPTSNELFGNQDGIDLGNTNLRPEYSHNYNLGLSREKPVGAKGLLFADLTLSYRDVNDYIQRVPDNSRGTAGFANFDKVRNWGVSTEVRYTLADRLAFGVNATYQDIRNRSSEQQGTTIANPNFNVRLPNTPFLFGNADASWSLPNAFKKGNRLGVGYTAQYVYQFPLEWIIYGTASSKQIVPDQFAHNVNVFYSLQGGRYSVTAECWNLTDARIYDNFSLQKPSRSFTLKLRYAFLK